MVKNEILDGLEMGFISPTGEWLPVPFCEHEGKAAEILETYKYEYDGCECATDVLIEKYGYILIDGCREVDIQIPRIITNPQKVTFEKWLFKNEKFIEKMSMDSLNNLSRLVDWVSKR